MEVRREILGIIPARGGSKGVPGKNIRLLGGRPLIAHSIEQLKQTAAVTRIVVSTDDPQIASVAEEWGVEVVDRPHEISGDEASSESALLHVLDHLREKEHYEPEIVVFLQATSPLRAPGDIRSAIEAFDREKADSLFSASPIEGFAWRLTKKAVSAMNYDPTRRPRRQELDAQTVEENGSIYVFKPWILRSFQSRLGGRIATWQMSRLDSFQIDRLSDFELIEKLLLLRPVARNISILADIQLLVLDFDGVMTDNRVSVDQEGTESVWCNRGDGWGLARLKDYGLEVIVISTEANPVVAARCRKLGLECHQGSSDKLASLRAAVGKRNLGPASVAYVGNDVNDLECLRWVGVPIVVADAWPTLGPLARLTTTRRGGFGAVREVAEWILEAKRGS